MNVETMFTLLSHTNPTLTKSCKRMQKVLLSGHFTLQPLFPVFLLSSSFSGSTYNMFSYCGILSLFCKINSLIRLMGTIHYPIVKFKPTLQILIYQSQCILTHNCFHFEMNYMYMQEFSVQMHLTRMST